MALLYFIKCSSLVFMNPLPTLVPTNPNVAAAAINDSSSCVNLFPSETIASVSGLVSLSSTSLAGGLLILLLHIVVVDWPTCSSVRLRFHVTLADSSSSALGVSLVSLFALLSVSLSSVSTALFPALFPAVAAD